MSPHSSAHVRRPLVLPGILVPMLARSYRVSWLWSAVSGHRLHLCCTTELRVAEVHCFALLHCPIHRACTCKSIQPITTLSVVRSIAPPWCRVPLVTFPVVLGVFLFSWRRDSLCGVQVHERGDISRFWVHIIRGLHLNGRDHLSTAKCVVLAQVLPLHELSCRRGIRLRQLDILSLLHLHSELLRGGCGAHQCLLYPLWQRNHLCECC